MYWLVLPLTKLQDLRVGHHHSQNTEIRSIYRSIDLDTLFHSKLNINYIVQEGIRFFYFMHIFKGHLFLEAKQTEDLRHLGLT